MLNWPLWGHHCLQREPPHTPNCSHLDNNSRQNMYVFILVFHLLITKIHRNFLHSTMQACPIRVGIWVMWILPLTIFVLYHLLHTYTLLQNLAMRSLEEQLQLCVERHEETEDRVRTQAVTNTTLTTTITRLRGEILALTNELTEMRAVSWILLVHSLSICQKSFNNKQLSSDK